ncbi:MAG TPA: response regulator [Devosiaceae bacterium]|nr:response regulator [Devosiaceae bacterium]
MSETPVISIVDDDASIRGATARLVRLNGFTAHVFSSAEEFLQSPRVEDTSCLITDVKMGGMSGLDLQRHLIGLGSRMPIIFITAFPDEANKAKAMEGGAACVLAKPFDGQTLIDCLAQVLQAGAGKQP